MNEENYLQVKLAKMSFRGNCNFDVCKTETFILR